MEDRLLKASEAMKELGMPEKTFFRYLRARAFPFIRTGFYEDLKGKLYFSKLRLREQFDPGERRVIEEEEFQEKQLALKLLQLDADVIRLLEKSFEEDLDEDEKEDVDFDLSEKGKESRKLLKEYEALRRQRIERFFGRETAIRFFPKVFPVEAKKREQAITKDSTFLLHYGSPEEIEAQRLKEQRAEEKRRREYFQHHYIAQPGDKEEKK